MARSTDMSLDELVEAINSPSAPQKFCIGEIVEIAKHDQGESPQACSALEGLLKHEDSKIRRYAYEHGCTIKGLDGLLDKVLDAYARENKF